MVLTLGQAQVREEWQWTVVETKLRLLFSVVECGDEPDGQLQPKLLPLKAYWQLLPSSMRVHDDCPQPLACRSRSLNLFHGMSQTRL